MNTAKLINLECTGVNKYRNDYKFRTKEYDFFKLNDTVINSKTYSLFKLASIKPRKEKRLQLATKFYILDKDTAFHLPLLDFSTAYEEWKLNRILPNGLFYQKYTINYGGRISGKETLLNYTKINKKIIISEDCDYTKKLASPALKTNNLMKNQ